MANMSYCRFENTLGDLADCERALGTMSIDEVADMDEHEKRARSRLIKLCVSIALDYGLEVGSEVVEVD